MSIIQNPIALRRWALALGITLGSIAAAGCGGDDDDSASTGNNRGGGTSSGDVTYQVDALQYKDVTAPAGGKIDIQNNSGAGHTFTSDDDNLFDVSYGSGDTATVDVPDQPGTYGFHCNIHSSMTATLTVQ